MDNRLFNVNGRGEDMLRLSLRLAFLQHCDNVKVKAWSQSKEHGLVLHWSDSHPDSQQFMAPLSADEVTPMVLAWLRSDFASNVKLGEWCDDHDHDGTNSSGWQVYCEDWGHVGSATNTLCAIRPAFLWHGK